MRPRAPPHAYLPDPRRGPSGERSKAGGLMRLDDVESLANSLFRHDV
jgi:hypothetical protein